MNSARAGRARTETLRALVRVGLHFFKFALNFRPQSIFLRDCGEAFVIVRVTSTPSPIPSRRERQERLRLQQAGAQRSLSATDAWTGWV